MTKTRDLIQRLADALNGLSVHLEADSPVPQVASAIRAWKEARDYLAQPEPEWPTDQELLDWASHVGIDYVGSNRPSDLDHEKAPVRSDELILFARIIRRDHHSSGEQRFCLTWGQFKALKKLIKELDK